MVRFAVGQPIKTREPSIVVDPGLEPGLHRFQLEVRTEDGRTSAPDVVEVAVKEGPISDPIVRPG